MTAITEPRRAPRKRAEQQRAKETRAHLLKAATDLFSTFGYDGVSIRTIEAHAEVKRGLVAHHFGTKEALWKAVVEDMFADMSRLLGEDDPALADLPAEARFQAYLSAFIRFSAARPEINRMMVQEGKAKSWRLDYLLERFVRPRVDWTQEIVGKEVDPHTHYMMIGAATFVFDVEFECEALFGINPRSEEFVRQHAKAVCNLFADLVHSSSGY